MSEVDYCITTMNRPQALERLLFSIATHRPDASIHIADQSERFDRSASELLNERLQEAGLRKAPTLHRLPFDCGVSVARNYLIDSTPNPYKLSLDDDFMFTKATNVDALVSLLEAYPEAGIAGGAVTREGQVRHFATCFERSGNSALQLKCKGPFDEHDGLRFLRAGCVPLFVLIRRELFAHLRWDPALKIFGHFDFFFRLAETPYEVLFTPDVTIDHPPTQADPDYMRLRRRGEFVRLMLRKHKLTSLTMANGSVWTL